MLEKLNEIAEKKRKIIKKRIKASKEVLEI